MLSDTRRSVAEPSSRAMYAIRLLGAAEVVGPGGRMSGRIAQRRQLGLLAVLALANGRVVPRDKLLALFWPESDAERARHNLADSVYHVRKALGEDAILSIGDDLVLNAARVATDVGAFEEALAGEDAEAALRLYVGPLLDGFHVTDASGFEHWLDAERSRLERAWVQALERVALRSTEEGRLTDAAGWWRQLAETEPLNTRIALATMRALAAADDRAAAIRHAHVHSAHLEAELGAEPDAEVLALAEKLTRSTCLRSGDAGSAASRDAVQTWSAISARSGDRSDASGNGAASALAEPAVHRAHRLPDPAVDRDAISDRSHSPPPKKFSCTAATPWTWKRSLRSGL